MKWEDLAAIALGAVLVAGAQYLKLATIGEFGILLIGMGIHKPSEMRKSVQKRMSIAPPPPKEE